MRLCLCLFVHLTLVAQEVLLDGGYLHAGDLGVLQSIDLVGAGTGPAIIEGCVTLDCGAAQAGGKLRNLVLRGRGGTVVTIISGVWELTGCRVESAGHGCGIKVRHPPSLASPFSSL
jgi:hypothetical protein